MKKKIFFMKKRISFHINNSLIIYLQDWNKGVKTFIDNWISMS